jgi:hypothetical protein
MMAASICLASPAAQSALVLVEKEIWDSLTSTEAYAWIKDGSCSLIVKWRPKAEELTFSATDTAEVRAQRILNTLYKLASDQGVSVTALYCSYAPQEGIDVDPDEVIIELTRHTWNEHVGCICNPDTRTCCSPTVVQHEKSVELSELHDCQTVSRSAFDQVVVYVQDAESSWGFDTAIGSFRAPSTEWRFVVPYSSGSSGTPMAACGENGNRAQVTIVIAEVERCEGVGTEACFRIRTTGELVSDLVRRLCATRVVLVLIESDGSLLDRTSLLPELHGSFATLYFAPVAGRIEQAGVLAAALISRDPSGCPDMVWLLSQLRALSFQAIFRPAKSSGGAQ